jgi:hypothetical protein
MTTKKPADSPSPFKPGLGLDIGTMNLVSARSALSGEVHTKSMRDAFLDFPLDSKKMLQLANTPFVERDDAIIILGDHAMQAANVFGREVRRPLSGGLIAAGEIDALEILQILIQGIVGKPVEPGEVCCYSIPANPVDVPGKDNTYHSGVFENILFKMGYDPIPSNEAQAIIYSECAADRFSGVALSFGAGMVNISASFNTQAIPELQISLARGGDWIDAQSAANLGVSASKMCSIKEKGIDLSNPVTREEQALVIYYRNLIQYSLDGIANRYKTHGGAVNFPEAVPMIVSGGTSLAKGFLELFQEVFERKQRRFPIPISEVRAAADPLKAVAHGLMLQAQQEST